MIPGSFDGVWRPEPWVGPKNWRAVSYRNDGRHGVRRMDGERFEREAGAITRCDELNATREAVRQPQESQNRPQTLL